MSRFARLAAVCLLAGVPLYWALGTWPATPDGWLHLQRVRALGEAFAAGVIYPRWFPDFAFGYGYPVLNYYAPGFYVGPALLAAAGLDVLTAVRLSLAAWFGLSAVGMTVLLRRWAGVWPAAVGVVLFLVFPYRLYDLFVRGALPEFAAFLWLPLIVYWTVRGAEAGRGWPEGAVRLLPAALGWGGLVLTHNLTALMAGVTALLVLPVAAWLGGGAGGRRAAVVILGPLLLGALLSAWYWAPAIFEAGAVGIGAGAETRGYANHFATWATLLTWAPVFPYPDAAAATVPLPGFVLLVVGLAGAGLAAAGRRGRGGKTRGRAGVAVLAGSLLAAVVAVWLTTASSEFVWEALAPVLGKLQFPWRWQAIVGASVPLLLAVGWAVVAGKGGPAEGPRGWRRYGGAAAWAAAGAFFLAYSLPGLAVTPASGAQADITTRGMWAVDRQNGQVGASWTAEFLPNTVTEQRWAIGRAPGDGSSAAEAEPLAMAAVPQRLGYLGGTYAVDFGAPGRLILHQFAFPAWRVTVDGVPVAAQAEGALGLLAVDLPAGAHTVTVAWGATAAVWMGRVLTAAGWAFVLWVLAAQAGEERRGRRVGAGARGRAGAAWLAVAAWLGVGIVLVAGASGVTARSGVPQPVGADFGAVRLEAAEVHPARPGTVAQVRLHWAVEGPVEPLVAYVHVVDAAGAVVAQDDGPLGGEYTPAERWAPGLLLPHTHEVLLPADLAPGAYQVLAGVYRPGEAGAPLVAEGTGETRVPAGVLEVRP